MWKCLIREKSQLFWNLLFPILLGTMFHIAFSGFSEDEAFHPIPVAVVEQEMSENVLHEMLDTLERSEEKTFLDASYVSEEEALSLLKEKKIIGILYEGNPVTLKISAEMSSNKLEQSILTSFVSQFNLNYAALENIARNHPENLRTAIGLLSKESDYNQETSYSNGTMDLSLEYFFSLIAMSCLFAHIGGVRVALKSQANLSPLGARKCLAPVNKLLSTISELLAAFLYHFLCLAICLFYLIFALKIDFGNQFGYILLATLLGSMTGVSLGFFFGSIGTISENVKGGILLSITMVCSFFSGLMVGNMRIVVEKYCPLFNHLNPAALISDSFYALTVYRSHERYFQNLGILLLLTIGFCFGGFLFIRRRKYAAL